MQRNKIRRIAKYILIRLLWLAGILIIVGILYIVYLIFRFESYRIYDNDYSSVDILKDKISLSITNNYKINAWQYNEFGILYSRLISKDEKYFIDFTKIESLVSEEIFYVKIRETEKYLLEQLFASYILNEVTIKNFYFYKTSIIMRKKIPIRGAYVKGTLLRDTFEENDRLRFRLIYTKQYRLGFMQRKNNLSSAGILIWFNLIDEPIPTDIAIVELKNEPGNIYMAITFDKYAGENHEAIKMFLKRYFDITVRD